MIKKFEFDTADRIEIFGKWDSSVFRYDTKLSPILSKLINRAGIICEKIHQTFLVSGIMS